jgi:hypothetical protein
MHSRSCSVCDFLMYFQTGSTRRDLNGFLPAWWRLPAPYWVSGFGAHVRRSRGVKSSRRWLLGTGALTIQWALAGSRLWHLGTLSLSLFASGGTPRLVRSFWSALDRSQVGRCSHRVVLRRRHESLGAQLIGDLIALRPLPVLRQCSLYSMRSGCFACPRRANSWA